MRVDSMRIDAAGPADAAGIAAASAAAIPAAAGQKTTPKGIFFCSFIPPDTIDSIVIHTEFDAGDLLGI